MHGAGRSRITHPFATLTPAASCQGSRSTCPMHRNSSWKRVVMPDVPHERMRVWERLFAAWDGVASYQLVGGVTAYQGVDG